MRFAFFNTISHLSHPYRPFDSVTTTYPYPTVCIPNSQLPPTTRFPLPAYSTHVLQTDQTRHPSACRPISQPNQADLYPGFVLSYHIIIASQRIASPPVGFLKLRIDYYYHLLYYHYYTSHTAPVRSRRRRRRPVLPPAKTVTVQINAGSWVEVGVWMDGWFLTVLVLHLCSRRDD